MPVVPLYLGEKQSRIDLEGDVTLEDPIRYAILRALWTVADQTTSHLVRIDMAPWDGVGTPPFFEVETAPGGLMLWSLMQSPEAMALLVQNPHAFVERPELGALAPLPQPVCNLADSVMCTWPDWELPYSILAHQSGWTLRLGAQGWQDLPVGGRVYFSGDADEVVAGDYSLVTDPFASKSMVLQLSGGEVITDAAELTVSSLLEKYPTGFVVKPDDGSGAKDVFIHAPLDHVLKRRGDTATRVTRALQGIQGQRRWLIQPFFKPTQEGDEFTIWRLYAMRSTLDGQFRLLGGIWNRRPSLIVHGTRDSVFGLVN